MGVYVDRSAHRFGRMVMCHMIADTPAELRTMAASIGVALKWFQNTASTPHFDISKSKRVLAIAAGAIELDRREFVDTMKRIRQNWPNDRAGRWSLWSQA